MTILVTGGAGFIGSNFVLDWLADPAADASAAVEAQVKSMNDAAAAAADTAKKVEAAKAAAAAAAAAAEQKADQAGAE